MTSAGLPVFVKRVGGAEIDIRRRMKRIAAMGELLDTDRGVNAPRFLGGDEGPTWVAFTLLAGLRRAWPIPVARGSAGTGRSAGLQLGACTALTSSGPGGRGRLGAAAARSRA